MVIAGIRECTAVGLLIRPDIGQRNVHTALRGFPTSHGATLLTTTAVGPTCRMDGSGFLKQDGRTLSTRRRWLRSCRSMTRVLARSLRRARFQLDPESV